MADCPICSKGTVLEDRRRPARRSAGAGTRAKAARAPTAAFSGPHVSAGPYSEGGASYEVRLERVPGGVRLAEWDGAGLRRRAPVLDAADLRALARDAGRVLDERAGARLAEAALARPESREAGPASPSASFGRSRGRSGDFKEELRVEALADGRLRVARWVLRPGSGWELQDAPPMLPAARYAEALADAARQGVLRAASDAEDPARL